MGTNIFRLKWGDKQLYSEQEGTNIHSWKEGDKYFFTEGGTNISCRDGGGDNDVDGGQEEDMSEEAPQNFY